MAFAMKVTSQVEAQRKILEEAVSTALMLASEKSDGAEVAVSKMFQARTVTKSYIALVQGRLQGAGSVNEPLIADWETPAPNGAL